MNRRKKSREPSKRQAKRRGQIHDFCSKIGMSPRQIFLAGALVAGLSGIIAWVLISESLSVANDSARRSADEISEREAVQSKLDSLGELPASKGNRLGIAAELKQRVQILEELPQTYSLTFEQQKQLDRVTLFNLRHLASELIKENIDFSHEVENLMSRATELLDDEDALTRSVAANAICSVRVSLFAHRAKKEQWDSLSECLTEHKEAFINDEAKATELFRELMRLRRTEPNNKLAQSAFKKLGEVFRESSSKEVTDLAQRCDLMAELSNYNFRYLEEMVRFADPKADNSLNKIVATFKSNPGTEVETWKILLRVCEAYLAKGATSKLDDLNKELVTLAESTSFGSKSNVLDLLSRQRARLNLIGKKFNVTGEWIEDMQEGTVLSNSISAGSKNTAVLFSNGNPLSAREVKALTSRNFDTSKCQYVVALEDPPNETKLAALKRLDPKIQIATAKTVESFHAQIPIDFCPYSVLVDPSGTVVALNFSATQLQSHLPKNR